MRKILRINLDKKTFEMESMPAQYAKLGGRGLSSTIICTEVPPKSDPLGKENKLVLAPGILAGTKVTCSGRLSIGLKSPLTNTVKEANAGGELAGQIVKLGIHTVIIEGTAAELTLLKIDKTGVTFESATSLQGVGNYECLETLKKKHGEKSGVISIGPAGEMKLTAAAIAVSTKDEHLRFAARGGVGAVMGAKNLKAILVNDEGGKAVEIADKNALKESAKALSKGILSHPLAEGLKALGSPLLLNMIDAMGALSTKNFSQGRFEKAGQISGETLVGLTSTRPNSKPAHACMSGCVIQCSNVLTDEKGELICSSIEFETLALLGSNCMIDDLEKIVELNRVCNDIGLDTMDVGGALGVAMEEGVLPWGDADSALALLNEIKTGGEKGIMIGNGAQFTGNKLGAKRIPTVKGQSLAAYDPRALKGTGTTYATSTMGADHTCGNALPSPTMPDYDPVAPTGQADISRFLQGYFAAIDSLGMCLFASLPLLDIPDVKQLLIDCTAAVLGEKLDENYLEQLGESVVKVERGFNLNAGFASIDDRLPDFFTKEKLPGADTTFDVSEAELDSVHTG